MSNLASLRIYIVYVQQIRTAYRKKALGCHPDKHPDNPGAGNSEICSNYCIVRCVRLEFSPHALLCSEAISPVVQSVGNPNRRCCKGACIVTLNIVLDVIISVRLFSLQCAYDKVLRGRAAAEIRNKQLDSKRRKLKEELEARERNAEQDKYDAIFEAKKLNEEIIRLRKQGSQMLNEEIELMRQQIAKESREKLSL